MATMHRLSVWDYVVVAGMLLISTLIGIAFAFKNRRQQNMQELFLGGRQMGVFPVTMSLIASFLSAIMILGTTAETYLYGILYAIFPFCFIVVMPITAFLFLPVFYHLKITSAYQYLEYRFHSHVLRKAASAAFIFQMLLYMAAVLYAPSLAINAIMGFNVWLSVIVCGVVCTLYTSLVLMMLSGLLAILIHGCISLGGPGQIWNTAVDLGRMDSDMLQFTPFKRYDIYSVLFGGAFLWLPIYCANQSQIQRAVSCQSLKTAQRAFLINIPGMLLLVVLGCTVGLVVLAYFKDCDPILDGTIQSADQLLPLYVMAELTQYPGVPGLFMASIFSGSLSTISSGINSLATVIMDDFVSACYPRMSRRNQNVAAKLITVFVGVIVILLTFVASKMGSLTKVALSMFGMIGGPVLGVFVLGMFCPPANSKGAIVGLIVGLAQQFWIGFGSVLYGSPSESLPRSTAGCDMYNSTYINSTWEDITTSYNTTNMACFNCTLTVDDHRTTLELLYSISYMYYGFIALIVTTSVGLLVSFITGRTKSYDINPLTLSPLASWMCGYRDVDLNSSDYDPDTLEPLSNKRNATYALG